MSRIVADVNYCTFKVFNIINKFPMERVFKKTPGAMVSFIKCLSIGVE